MKSKEKIYSIGCILFLFDQIIKLIVKNNMILLDEIKVIPGFFSIYYVENKGAAFSILGGATIFLVLISFVVLFILDKYIKKEKSFSKLGIVSLGMIMGGILGNLVDRLLYKVVIDYLSFELFSYSFPVFNIADIGITVGALLFIIDMIRSDRNGNQSRRFRRIKNR